MLRTPALHGIQQSAQRKRDCWFQAKAEAARVARYRVVRSTRSALVPVRSNGVVPSQAVHDAHVRFHRHEAAVLLVPFSPKFWMLPQSG